MRFWSTPHTLVLGLLLLVGLGGVFSLAGVSAGARPVVPLAALATRLAPAGTPVPTPTPCCIMTGTIQPTCSYDPGTGQTTVSLTGTIVNPCPTPVSLAANFYLEVSPDGISYGFIQRTSILNYTFQPGSNPISAAFFPQTVPPQDVYYRIRMQIYMCGIYSIYSPAYPLCGLVTPTATPVPTPPPSATPTPTACAPSEAWRQRAPYTTTVVGPAVAGQGGFVYSFGGYLPTIAGTAAYKYDPVADSWSPIAPLPAPRAEGAAVSDGTYIYILGGADANANRMGNLWRYDPASNTYDTALAPYTIGTIWHGGAYLNGKIYRITGRSNAGSTTSVEVYTISTNSWAMAATYPLAAQGATAFALGGYVYAAGGGIANGSKTYRYDPASNTWDDAAIADLPGPRRWLASDGYNGRWLIAGGYDDNSSYLASALAWDPGSNTWLPLPSMQLGRSNLGGATAGGAFYALGGYTAPGATTADYERYGLLPCGTTTPVATATPPATATRSVTATPPRPTSSPTLPATALATRTPSPAPPSASPTPTTCTISFSDVDQTNPFYIYIRCLACRGIVSGYADGTYRWTNNVTRGQLSKILANAAGFADPIPSGQQTFADVPPAQPFWLWIERLAGHGAISGYACGGPGEPCDPALRPYFRPGATATRGQLSKITALAAAIADPVPTTRQTFADVPPGNPFWLWVEQLAGRGIISGYACGGPGEPCDPALQPYFRWGATATRGQMAKIAANTFFPACQTPAMSDER